MKCPNCGTENPSNATFCASCGTKLPEPVRQTSTPQASSESCPVALKVVSFIIPLVGWVLWGAWRKEHPQKASEVALMAWIGFAVWFVINMLSM